MFWLVLSKVMPPSDVGIVGATVGLASLVASVTNAGIAYGIQRFVGRHHGRDREALLSYMGAATLYIGVLSLAGGGAILLALRGRLLQSGYTSEMLLLAYVLAVVIALGQVYWGALVAAFKTRLLALTTAAAQAARVILVVLLAVAGWLTWREAAVTYAAQPLAAIAGAALGGLLAFRLPRRLLSAVRELVEAGIVGWIPSLLLVASQWMGVVAVYVYREAAKTGIYYIAFMVFLAVSGPSIMIANMLLPAASGGRVNPRLQASILAEGLGLVAPIAVSVFLEPSLYLSLVSSDYAQGGPALRILLLSLPGLALFTVVYNTYYGSGLYARALALGLAQNLPRFAGYLLLVGPYGDLGAALAYTLGTYVGAAALLLYEPPSRLARLALEEARMLAPPLALGAAALPLLHASPAAVLAPLLAYVVYQKLGWINVKAIVKSLLSTK